MIRKAWTGNVSGCFLAPSQAVRLVFDVARLDRILPLASTIGEARLLIAKDAAAACLRPVADEERGVLLFTMPSRISAEVAENFGRAVRAEWDGRPTMRKMVLDLAETNFIDSSGLGFLIRCHRMTAQRALTALHFYAGAPDGVIGMGARAALRAWQKARGLTADGYLSPDIVQRLKSEAGG